MERLMRLVVAQGETIQTQLRRMQERDQQIENFEHQLHLLRVQSLGSDYLLQSYLKEPQHQDVQQFSKEELLCEEKSNDSGVVTEEVPELEAHPLPTERLNQPPLPQKEEVKQGEHLTDLEEVRARTILLDKLDKVLIRLLEHEDVLSKLEDSLAESTVCEMAQLQEEIANATIVHANTVANARQNEQKLRELDIVLYQRRVTLDSLLAEDLKYEEEALALQAHLDYIIHLPPTAFRLSSEEQTGTFDPFSTNYLKSLPFVSTKHAPQSKSPQPLNSQATKITSKPIESKEISNLNSSNTKVTSQDAISPLRSLSRLENVDVLNVRETPPPPLPSTSPPPLDEDDDKDSGKTSSICVSSRSSTSSETSRGGTSPCDGSTPKSGPKEPSLPAEPPKDVDSTDSNSDTGLSSLHSSSDEGAYVLDTLV